MWRSIIKGIIHHFPLCIQREVLREEFMEPYGVSAIALAKACHVPRTRIERIVREEIGITTDTALRLSKVFNTTPQFWLKSTVSLRDRDSQQGDRPRAQADPRVGARGLIELRRWKCVRYPKCHTEAPRIRTRALHVCAFVIPSVETRYTEVGCSYGLLPRPRQRKIPPCRSDASKNRFRRCAERVRDLA